MDDNHPVFGPSRPQDESQHDPAHEEITRPLPPYNPAPQSTQTTQPSPHARRATVTAGVLVGALVLGGAAGVGGAAAYVARPR